MVINISLSNNFGKQIITRRAISEFFNALEQLKENNITLDFSSIRFISRSCADEYLKRKRYSKIKFKEVNVSENIFRMFSLALFQLRKSFGIVTN